MAEVARCGRRKQRNPKRKNVENDVDEKIKTEKAQLPLKKKQTNGNHDNQIIHDKDTDCSLDNKVKIHDNKIGKDVLTASASNKQSFCSEMVPPSSVPSKQSFCSEMVPPSSVPNTISDDKPSAKLTESSTQEIGSVVLPCKTPVCVGNTSGSSEDEKIQEYLNRSDTAVIYPEPVSDREDNTAEDEDDQQDGQDNDSSLGLDEEIILKCFHCTQTFTRASLLRDHMKIVHPDKPVRYLCPKCDETFQLKSHLDKHLALHSPTSQSCRVCNKTFANVYRLQRHMISHDESTDLRKFKCPECGKAFKFKHHLKEHVRIHSGEKPFKCPNCQKRFSHSGSYSSHMTSKKCWIVGQNRNHNSDAVRTTESNTPYSPARTSVTAIDPSMNMLTTSSGSFPHVPFMPFDPTKTGLPAYYSPPFIPITAYSMIRHSTPIKPVMSSLLHQPADSHSGVPSAALYHPTQISPDVNSNTQLISMQKTIVKQEPAVIKEEPLVSKEMSKPPEDDIMQCKEKEDIKEVKVEDSKTDDKPTKENDEKMQCRFCGENFKSAVEQHQHERYICKMNKDVVQRISCSDSSRNSPCSTISEGSHHGTPNGSLSAQDSDPDETEEIFKDDNSSSDSKKFRMRSLISDEQLAVLKSYYRRNPRPRKYELIRIGNEIGFPKRVVQVWFQNMRARDRRQGKNVPYFPSMARFKRQESPSLLWKDPKTSQSYIPVVPNPTLAHSGKMNGSVTPPKTSVSEEQPLDLSVHNRPPSHNSANQPISTQPGSMPSSNSALNLSVKSENVENRQKMDGSVQNSAIYKYLQQEGLFARHMLGQSIVPTVPNMMHSLFAHNPFTIKKDPHVKPLEQRSKSLEPVVKPVSTSSPSTAKVSFTGLTSQDGYQNGEHDMSSGRLVIDESPDEDSNSSSDEYSDSDASYRDRARHDAAMADATLNLATLAEVSLSQRAAALLDGTMKSKRLRKKSWRQMEADEVQLDLEDSLLDDDHPFPKKRRSWKGHKVDADEGMYACDQCKKMFSKQSSLARHKYEHSGARPFSCEICAKAFKHKHHLTEHRRLHSGEKPFECKKCGKRFSHSGSYSQHMNHRYKYCKPMRSDDGFSST